MGKDCGVRDLFDVRRAPLSYALLVVLLTTTVVQHLVGGSTAHAWLMGSSTDVTNLAHRPLYVLLTSAAWLPDGFWSPYAVVFVLILVPLERSIGTGWALLVYVSGHVGATILTEGPTALAVAARWLPHSADTRMDVGVSYVVFVAVGVYLGMLRGRARTIVAVATGIGLVAPMVVDFDLTTLGHVLSVAIGLAWWPWLRRTGWLGRLPSLAAAMRPSPALGVPDRAPAGVSR
jgi:hypothetical protein